jgi:predicted site-specific integrase-resolvase
MSIYSLSHFAAFIGMSVKTLQRWDREGRLKAGRTPTGRRFYTDEHLRKAIGKRVVEQPRKTICYVRVSSQAQKPDLKNQQEALEGFCIARGLIVDEWVKEIGGGMNFKRPKFITLIDAIIAGQVQRLVIAHKDRLVRFGFDLIKHLATKHGCELVVMNSEALSPERERVEDLMAVTHCFSARLYGLRDYKKSLREALKQDAQSA